MRLLCGRCRGRQPEGQTAWRVEIEDKPKNKIEPKVIALPSGGSQQAVDAKRSMVSPGRQPGAGVLESEGTSSSRSRVNQRRHAKGRGVPQVRIDRVIVSRSRSGAPSIWARSSFETRLCASGTVCDQAAPRGDEGTGDDRMVGRGSGGACSDPSAARRPRRCCTSWPSAWTSAPQTDPAVPIFQAHSTPPRRSGTRGREIAAARKSAGWSADPGTSRSGRPSGDGTPSGLGDVAAARAARRCPGLQVVKRQGRPGLAVVQQIVVCQPHGTAGGGERLDGDRRSAEERTSRAPPPARAAPRCSARLSDGEIRLARKPRGALDPRRMPAARGPGPGRPSGRASCRRRARSSPCPDDRTAAPGEPGCPRRCRISVVPDFCIILAAARRARLLDVAIDASASLGGRPRRRDVIGCPGPQSTVPSAVDRGDRGAGTARIEDLLDGDRVGDRKRSVSDHVRVHAEIIPVPARTDIGQTVRTAGRGSLLGVFGPRTGSFLSRTGCLLRIHVWRRHLPS